MHTQTRPLVWLPVGLVVVALVALAVYSQRDALTGYISSSSSPDGRGNSSPYDANLYTHLRQHRSAKEGQWWVPTRFFLGQEYGEPMEPPTAYLDQYHIVHLQGSLAKYYPGDKIFRLPIGFRPSSTMSFPVVTGLGEGVAKVVIYSNGNVYAGAGTMFEHISLDGVVFPSSTVHSDWEQVDLSQGTFEDGRPLQYYLASNGRIFLDGRPQDLKNGDKLAHLASQLSPSTEQRHAVLCGDEYAELQISNDGIIRAFSGVQWDPISVENMHFSTIGSSFTWAPLPLAIAEASEESPVAMSIDDAGVIYLRGRVTGAVRDEPMFALPEGYRPDKQQVYLGLSDRGAQPITIKPNGDVLTSQITGSWISVDGISIPIGISDDAPHEPIQGDCFKFTNTVNSAVQVCFKDSEASYCLKEVSVLAGEKGEFCPKPSEAELWINILVRLCDGDGDACTEYFDSGLLFDVACDGCTNLEIIGVRDECTLADDGERWYWIFDQEDCRGCSLAGQPTSQGRCWGDFSRVMEDITCRVNCRYNEVIAPRDAFRGADVSVIGCLTKENQRCYKHYPGDHTKDDWDA